MTQFMWRVAGAFGLDAMLRALTGLPVVGPVAFVIGSIWMFVAIIGIAFAPSVF